MLRVHFPLQGAITYPHSYRDWFLFGEESEAQLLASFAEYAERNDEQLLRWTFCNQKEIALVCSKTMGGNTVALVIRTPGSQDDFAKEVARIMGNVAANIGKRMQCTADIRSLQPCSAGVSGIPYMVGRSRRTTQIGYLHH